jgi:hypothetical protein
MPSLPIRLKPNSKQLLPKFGSFTPTHLVKLPPNGFFPCGATMPRTLAAQPEVAMYQALTIILMG